MSGDDEANAEEPTEDDEEEADSFDRPDSVMAGADGPFDDAFSLDSSGENAPASPFDGLAPDAASEDVDFDRLAEEMFTEAGTEEIDEEWVWDELEGRGTEETETSGEEHVVPTRAFCAQCEHVAEPPEVGCTYEGSEIVEFIDRESVRVRNCPIVARRHRVSEMD